MTQLSYKMDKLLKELRIYEERCDNPIALVCGVIALETKLTDAEKEIEALRKEVDRTKMDLEEYIAREKAVGYSE